MTGDDDKLIDLRRYKAKREEERNDGEFWGELSELAQSCYRAEQAFRLAIKEQNKVRSPLIETWAGRCLAHAECCKLEESQIEYLRLVSGFRFRNRGQELNRSLAWLEPMRCEDIFDKYMVLTTDYCGFGNNRNWKDELLFDKEPMQRPSEIWAKIRRVHEIEGVSPEGTIERELEDFTREKEIREERLGEPPTIFTGFTCDKSLGGFARRV